MTPICNHCGTKFPGHERCKFCGQDPNTKRTVSDAIRDINVAARAATEKMRLLVPVFERGRQLDIKQRRRTRAVVRSVVNQSKPHGRKHGRPK